LEEEEQVRSTQLHTGDTILDLEQARIRMEQQERSYQTKKRGNQLVKAVNERLMRKMVSRTEYYMQQILPLLTSGRYHDVRLTTEEEEGTSSGGPFRLRVWETAAGEYISKTALSGGTADQLSLALRLAFAIAVLPRELTLAPGFLILDEPLSSFDRERTQALVDVVTGESTTRHFEQAILISHSSAFDPALFPYHGYLENGVVVESNLPIVQIAQVSPEEQREVNKDKQISGGYDDGDASTMQIVAISLPAGSNK
jgi:DNA repair exonuclease SbcCD ATPase subunit